ncbi:hypothetical protein GH5_08475 [Leishmania sp. Ghana 2012 LV757]|uniref:hypothetical protein n=1 Tax=Leishmania sp. Ghana 2012 LV757 TaxID=2803181 RepID=UPI001B798084|nr:hypothetical protein GH5_08475 [Leishmania sp. Ghana 2012 LV757]
MYSDRLASSHHQRSRHDSRRAEPHSTVDGSALSSTMTLLPLRRRDRARDISAALTAPVVDYRPPQWTVSLLKSSGTLSRIPNLAAAATSLDCSNGGDSSGTAHAYYTPLQSVAAFTNARASSWIGGVAVPVSKTEETTLRSSPTVTRQPLAPFYAEAPPPSAAASARRDYEGVGRRVRAALAGGATVAAGRQFFGRSPPPPSASRSRQSHRRRGIAEVRPGYTTSTERARYRNSVTKKLVDLYDEVAELHACRKNMAFQVTQAMRTDPRHCKESRGEVRLAGKATPQQQSAVESVKDALEVLHGAMHELVAVYFTPEEKRFLGIDTHLFQTSAEKANAYQYAPPPPKRPPSSNGGARGDRGKTSTAATSPSASTPHSEVREEQGRRGEEEAATEGESHEHTVAATPTGRPTATPPPAPSGLTTPPGLSAPAPTSATTRRLRPLSSQQQQPNATKINNDDNNAWAASEPAASAAPNSARVSLPASPITVEVQSVAELAPLGTSPQSVAPSSPPLFSPVAPTAAPEEAEGVFGAVAEQQTAADSQTAKTEVPEGTPERAFAPGESLSTLGSAWPTDTAAGSPVHPHARPKQPPAAQPLVKVPVRGRDGHILITKVPPAVPPGTTWVKTQAQVPASASANLTAPPPPSQPPSRTAPAASRNDASGAENSAPQAPTKRVGFQRLLINSDSD